MRDKLIIIAMGLASFGVFTLLAPSETHEQARVDSTTDRYAGTEDSQSATTGQQLVTSNPEKILHAAVSASPGSSGEISNPRSAFLSELAAAGNDPERVVLMVEHRAISRGDAITAMEYGFMEFMDALDATGSGVSNDLTFQGVIAQLPAVQAGDVALTRLQCGASLCAASFSGGSRGQSEAAAWQLASARESSDGQAYATVFRWTEHSGYGEGRVIFTVDAGLNSIVHGTPRLASEN